VNAERHARIRAVFAAACDLPPEKQPAYLDKACEGDPELRARVELLLAHDADETVLLDERALEAGFQLRPGDGPADGPPPDSFAGYEIVREIHRGAQGVVYQAIQKAPKRKVAIKVMREGPFAGARGKVRFDREVQILGGLKHPNIVTIHESGTVGGSFYYVMDYISGRPPDEYMGGQQRSIDETLKLFAKICEAVNAAHLRGIIHRDLKPGNIRIDGNGEPHILDFGLAKIATQDIVQGDRMQVMTETGQFIGSLPWASPEQAGSSPDTIDIRTDVYSLGVILYQMLTGRFPYEVVGNMRDVLDNILKVEPDRPSTVARRINDEVETIVLKALSKERERRYQTAGEFARDVRHYLAGEPIEAKRDSVGYILRKQFRRHRVPVAVAVGVMVLTMIGFGVSSYFLRQTVLARQELQSALALASDERDKAQEAERKALGAKEVADKARADEARQRRLAQRRSYVANLLAADLSFRSNEISEAKRRLAACEPELRGWEWHYLKRITDTSIANWETGLVGPRHVSFTEDGRQLITFGKKRLKCWDVNTNDLLLSFDYNKIASEPDHDSEEKPTAVWENVAVDRAANRLAVHAVRGTDASFRIFDIREDRPRVELPGKWYQFAAAAAFSPDGRWIATGGINVLTHDGQTGGNLQLWDAESGRLHAILGVVKASRVRFIAFSPDGERLATTGLNQHTVCVWNVPSGERIDCLKPRGIATAAAFSPRGDQLAVVCFGGTVQLWDFPSGEWVGILKGHRTYSDALAFSPDGTLLVSGGNDKSIRLWHVPTGRQLKTMYGHEERIGDVAFSPDGRLIASVSDDGTVRLWNTLTPDDTLALTRPDVARGECCAQSPDRRHVARADEGYTLSVMDARLGIETARMSGHRDWVLSIVYSADGSRIVSSSRDGIVRVWNAETGEQVSMIEAMEGDWREKKVPPGFLSVAISPDGARVLSAGMIEVRVWDVATGLQLVALPVEQPRIVAYNPNGSVILTASEGPSARTTLHLWNASSFQLFLEIEEAPPGLECIAFSPDGVRVAAGFGDNSVRIWNAETGQATGKLLGHDMAVLSVTFSPDGTRIATGSSDSTVRIWDAGTCEMLMTLRAESLGRALGFTPDGSRLTAYGPWDRISRYWEAAPIAVEPGARRQFAQVFAEARANVDVLPDDSVLAEVVEHIRNDQVLREDVRETAIRLALLRWGTASSLTTNRERELEAESIVRSPGERKRAYAKALKAAEAASKEHPDNGVVLNTLGVAQYRVGAYEEALVTLTRSDEINGGIPADWAFIAMAHHQLGHTDQAMAALERLDKIIEAPNRTDNEDDGAFHREVHLLIEGRSPE